MLFGIVLLVLGLGAVCALAYNCAVYALPVAVGLWVGFGLLHTGAGSLGAAVLGFLAGGLTYGIARTVFEHSKSDLVRLLVAGVFVVPAALVGFSSGQQFSEMMISSHAWQQMWALVGGIAVGGTAFVRLGRPSQRA